MPKDRHFAILNKGAARVFDGIVFEGTIPDMWTIRSRNNSATLIVPKAAFDFLAPDDHITVVLSCIAHKIEEVEPPKEN